MNILTGGINKVMNEYKNTNFDIIVIGCGIAGLSAAVSAQQNGSKVAILGKGTSRGKRW
jgi:succinate dehydrogenase/fumarate reductase flavoprotein subunit